MSDETPDLEQILDAVERDIGREARETLEAAMGRETDQRDAGDSGTHNPAAQDARRGELRSAHKARVDGVDYLDAIRSKFRRGGE